MLKQRELQLAVGVAQARDNLMWLGAAWTMVAIGGAMNLKHTGSRVGLIPLGPLTFAGCYLYDFAYGNKLQRVIKSAGEILEEERQGGPGGTSMRFLPPVGNLMISKAEYEALFLAKTIHDDKKASE
mmetsp:Transcript_8767/g.20500  ORF Transcript_8767/g.20500 Transcript_8767/m.20500 type:complete len:127 (-) Transcript_8767:149-529(-)|eukprot:CAMPEP_0114126728 /NCGR_PEP_ID=MMETSP0043_2-20121206/9982_1 /TAXON_ID=464988 /ORGANISM="Hemiselmis andersenii, Strain CCMP644" /LENGTH=126 /DNA_ID=CAMNT_0001219727 /DNA_START=121 /DNA_END=501 /DNA_ORIENTATION=+